MKVKIGETVYNSEETPIMIIVNDEEKELIVNMGESDRFCSFPHDIDSKTMVEFMKK